MGLWRWLHDERHLQSNKRVAGGADLCIDVWGHHQRGQSHSFGSTADKRPSAGAAVRKLHQVRFQAVGCVVEDAGKSKAVILMGPNLDSPHTLVWICLATLDIKTTTLLKSCKLWNTTAQKVYTMQDCSYTEQV